MKKPAIVSPSTLSSREETADRFHKGFTCSRFFYFTFLTIFILKHILCQHFIVLKS